ncbi:MAG: signal peptidase I [Gammaproteobacteria bacterium]|nr:signal peptidase I [Gammaproteobacteria bacterium]
MSFNLALILTVLTGFTGLVVAINKFYWQRADRWKSSSHARQTLVEYCQSFFPVLLFVLIIRSFVFEPFRIPSGSMEPTLLQGDFIFVKKFSYGLRLPVSETKVLETGAPRRGDVIVFRLPRNPNINYIKRVVGLPGDVIRYDRHRLTINGETMQVEPPITVASGNGSMHYEQLFDRRHQIKVLFPESRENGVYTVPDGHFFMMGDNRDNSTDSRFPQVDVIAEEFLVGEAVLVWMHMDGLAWPDWGRIGTGIE